MKINSLFKKGISIEGGIMATGLLSCAVTFGALLLLTSRCEASAQQGLGLFIFAGFVCLLISGLMAWLCARRVGRTGNTLLETMEAIKGGNKGQRLVAEALSGSTGQFAISFNSVMDTMTKTITDVGNDAATLTFCTDELESLAKSLDAETKNLSSNAHVVAASTEQASSALQGISSATREMSTSVSTIASAIEEMNSSLNEVA
ncbi:MAG: methyl-accepting chemotaxis protein, partial [Spartobacteria bacterium]|nr:methyl-accepting chemotaxis protein [Spartobacteria bacterium]